MAEENARMKGDILRCAKEKARLIDEYTKDRDSFIQIHKDCVDKLGDAQKQRWTKIIGRLGIRRKEQQKGGMMEPSDEDTLDLLDTPTHSEITLLSKSA